MIGHADVNLRVLVVDDQKTMRSIARQLLRSIGIEDVVEAGDGTEALKILERAADRFPDLVVCDLHMQTMDGMQLCNAIRRNETLRNQGVPVLILTGDRDQMVHEVAKQVGAVMVLTKPVTAEVLKAEIIKAAGYAPA